VRATHDRPRAMGSSMTASEIEVNQVSMEVLVEQA
jgi:hypothetical protein